MHRALLIAVLVLVSAVFVIANALAKGGGGGHGAGMSGSAGGRSQSHMSEQGQLNTNAQFLPDSTRGLDRAQERMSDQGLENQKATSDEVLDAKKRGVRKR